MTGKAPNILVIQADQLAAPVLSIHGGGAKTPHIDALAASGTVFEQAYCNSPICASSRFSMMSGRAASEIAAYDNAAEFPAAEPTFAHHLRQQGYATALSGKMHFVGPDQLHGFETRLTSDIYPADFGWTPNWQEPDTHQDYFHSMLSVVDAGVCERSMQLDFDEEVGFHAQRWLYDHARSDDDRPFLLVASFTHPHDPYTITRPYWDRYDHAEIELPTVAAIPYAERDPHSQRLYRNCDMGRYDLNEARIRNARHAYHGAVSYIDDKVGALMQTLKASGFDGNTAVVFTADHGDMLGERGLWYKMCFFEWAARVPLLLRLPPDSSNAGSAVARVSRNVSLVDLFPTLADLAGGDAADLPLSLSGRSLLPLARGRDAEWSDCVYGEYLAEGAAGPLVMIRRGDYKYVVGEDSPPQLFDLAVDRHELTNLAGEPRHTEREAEFAEKVAARWDFATLRKDVIADQQRRLYVDRALKRGRYKAWDHQPAVDASRQYARNTEQVLGDFERRTRLPYVAAPEADGPDAAG